MVQEALAKQGIEIERKRIEVASHDIKMVGTYTVKVRLYEGESAHVKIEVLNEAVVKKQEAEKAAAEKAAAKAAAAEQKKSAAEAETEEAVEETYGAEGEDEDDLDADEE